MPFNILIHCYLSMFCILTENPSKSNPLEKFRPVYRLFNIF